MAAVAAMSAVAAMAMWTSGSVAWAGLFSTLSDNEKKTHGQSENKCMCHVRPQLDLKFFAGEELTTQRRHSE